MLPLTPDRELAVKKLNQSEEKETKQLKSRDALCCAKQSSVKTGCHD